ncbi:MAG: SusF/SusE family outer membrane protein [Prevotella sp.]|nr:SusF/SusE family outer membrane protein [Prevotella sp.]
MKSIYKLMMLPLMVLPLIFASCDTDDGSNPKLDLSHVSEGFVLNTPAYAENNTYDLVNSEGVWLTCSQPNYGGGVPYVVNYYVQVSLDPTFAQGNADAAYTELPSSYYLAKMQVNARELNDAVVELYQKAHPDAVTVPEKVTTYIKLRACIDGGMDKKLGETFSNVITLPSVHATYVAPDAEFKPNLFVIGSSIQEAWTSWKEVPKLAGIDGQYFTVIYVPAGGEFKWGTAEGDYKDYNALNSVTDKANAGAQANGDFNNIQFTNGGWYTLYFKGTITPDGKSIDYDLTIYPAEVYIFGNSNGGIWEFNDSWKLTAPADASADWVSPPFAAAGELRVSIKIPGIDWYRSEFTIYKGNLFFGNPTEDWAKSFGSDYSVQCAPGKKLYVNFDKNTAEVK